MRSNLELSLHALSPSLPLCPVEWAHPEPQARCLVHVAPGSSFKPRGLCLHRRLWPSCVLFPLYFSGTAPSIPHLMSYHPALTTQRCSEISPV